MTKKQLIKLASERKNISIEQAEKEISAIYDRTTQFTHELALRHYFEDQTHPNHNDYSHAEMNPIHEITE